MRRRRNELLCPAEIREDIYTRAHVDILKCDQRPTISTLTMMTLRFSRSYRWFVWRRFHWLMASEQFVVASDSSPHTARYTRWTQTHTHRNTHTDTDSRTHTHTHTHRDTRTHIHTRRDTHTHRQTETPTHAPYITYSRQIRTNSNNNTVTFASSVGYENHYIKMMTVVIIIILAIYVVDTMIYLRCNIFYRNDTKSATFKFLRGSRITHV